MTSSIAQNSAMRLSYKAYSSADIVPGTEPVASADPGASGGNQLRRVGSTLSFVKATQGSNEIRPDLQVYDFRHGLKGTKGMITGELSPLTYQDFMAAALRGSWVAGPSKTQADFTSIAATNASSKLTVGGSTWAAQGFMVGDVIRPTGMSVAANNRNFLITGLSGADAAVSPAPADQVADTSVGVSAPGRKVFAPTSSLVRSKFAIEHYYSDVDLAHLFTECRLGGMKANMPASGMATVEFDFDGRNISTLTTGASPFFTSPAAPTNTDILNTVGGTLTIAGVSQAIITAAQINVSLNQAVEQVAFSNLAPDIFQNRLDVSGSITALFTDNTLFNLFINETEAELALMLTANPDVNADFVRFFLPRVKINGSQFANSGNTGVPITLPFVGLLKASATGYDNTSLSIQDSLSA